jgi:hypothetical protein
VVVIVLKEEVNIDVDNEVEVKDCVKEELQLNPKGFGISKGRIEKRF